jgi:rod shape-determining protein MreC
MLLLTAFTLITLDYRSGGGGPLRRLGNSVFGPIERAVGAVTHPIGSFFSSLGNLNGYKSENDRLKRQTEELVRRLRLTDGERAQLASAEKLLNLAGNAQFRIVAARVLAVRSAFDFEWTATIDVGSTDGITKNQTVINGDGLVGKTLYVGPTTTTILLARDPKFTAGARLEGSRQIGRVDGGGRDPMTLTLLDSQARMHVGDRLVSFGSEADKPFVPEVPIGRITRIEPTPGQLYRTGIVDPYVNYTSLDLVSVVVGTPRPVKRDSLLPPTPSPSASPSASPTGSPGPTGSPSPGTSVSPSTEPTRTP